jgi:asparagine synthase (glutamine-hydrolysing)
MCGIAGIVDLAGTSPPDAVVLARMTARLAHRGPDGEGFHVSPGVGFGHRRLAIIDLATGAQPLYNEDASVVVIYNGEIYNFAELSVQLSALGHRFHTRSDTEVIVHAWEQWGEACLQRFNGMFAFALWDERQQTLFLARDRLGVKPLYYCWLPSGQLLFASELKSLLVHPAVTRTIEPRAVESYLAFGFIPDPLTIYRGVFRLEPGCFLSQQRGAARAHVQRYWDVPLFASSAPAASRQELCQELRDRLRESVRLRLVAEVPLGAFLSGGIDSSSVVAMMRALGKEPLVTCSIGFAERRFDESEFAELVARANRTDHQSEVMRAVDRNMLEGFIDIYDEPFADSSALPTLRVCRLARRFVTVALSGDGGDENFAGYRRNKLFRRQQRVREAVPEAWRRTLFEPLGRHYPGLAWAPRPLRLRESFQAWARATGEGYLYQLSIVSSAQREALFSAPFRRDLQGYHAVEVVDQLIAGKSREDPLRLAQYVDFRTYLPAGILTKVDRASMAFGLEVRGPFLDYTLVEWLAAQPSDLKLHRRTSKYLLKKALQPMLPRAIIQRSKRGFSLPIDEGLRHELRADAAHALTRGLLHNCGIFEPAALERLWSEHESRRANHGAALWALLVFEQFLRKQVAGPAGIAVSAAGSY